jgi:hypothetical protein
MNTFAENSMRLWSLEIWVRGCAEWSCGRNWYSYNVHDSWLTRYRPDPYEAHVTS